MRKIYYSISCLIFLVVAVANVNAQQDALVAGGDASGSNGSVSFSIGQPNYINTTNANGAITQGVQQPYEIQILTGVENTNVALSCKAYPNPTINTLYLELQAISGQSSYNYAVTNILGQQIMQHNISALITEIDLTNMAYGEYLIKVYDNNNEVKTFKIIKSK